MSTIKKSDIVEDKDIVKAFSDINAAIKESSKATLSLISDFNALQSSLKSVKGFDQLTASQKQYDTVQQSAIKTQTEAIKLQQQELKLREATAKAVNNATKEAEKEAKAIAKETSLYAQKSKALNEQRAAAKELGLQYGLTSKEFDKASKAVNKLDKELKDLDSSLGDHKRSVGNYGKAWDGLKGSIAWISGISAAISGAVAAGMAMLEVYKNFEKYTAILTNTFGDANQANEAMKMLRDTAQSLPIALDELVQSYIKLVNRGINPTKEELTKLSDVAYSQGKSMDMFVEAILDAQTGEFERLKEFGIKAKKSGDQISFTFKEQTTSVKYTEQAIKDYLVSLGDMQGVAGSSAAVMGTLSGKISNLGDAWDSLLLMFGEGGAGAFSKKVVDLFIVWIEKAKEYVTTIQESFRKFVPWWNELIKSSAGFRALVESLFQTFVVGAKIATAPLKLLYEQIKGIVLMLGNLSQGNFKAAFKNIIDAEVAFANTVVDTASSIYDAFKSIKGAMNEGDYEKYLISVEEAEKKTDKHASALKKQNEAKAESIKLTEAEIKAQKLLAAEKLAMEDQIRNPKSMGAKGIVGKINIEESPELKAQRELNKKILDETIAFNKAKSDKILSDEKILADTKKQIAHDAWSTGKDLVDTMFAIEQNNYDKDQKRIEDKYDAQESLLKKQLDNDKLTVDSRAQIEGQLKAIEAKKAEELKVIENKKRESQRKQFIINKAIAVAEIAMTTAQSVMKTYANLGAPWAIPLAIAVGAIGAVQAGLVIGQPMPAFDKGTENAPNTPFLVGEKGAEFVERNGKTRLVTEPTVMAGMGGAKITSRVETQRILQSNQKDRVWSSFNKGESLHNREQIEEQRETNRLLKSQKQVKVFVSGNVSGYAENGNATLRQTFKG